VGSLKLQLSQKLSEGKDTIGEERHEKLSKVSVILEDFTKRPLDESMVKKLFFIQDLMGEL
jgi:hypothetical protein